VLDLDLPGIYRVLHSSVDLRKSPSLNAEICGGSKKDSLVLGTPCQVGETQWLRLNITPAAMITPGMISPGKSWMAIGWPHLGLPMFLQRVEDVEASKAEDIAAELAEERKAEELAAKAKAEVQRRLLETRRAARLEAERRLSARRAEADRKLAAKAETDRKLAAKLDVERKLARSARATKESMSMMSRDQDKLASSLLRSGMPWRPYQGSQRSQMG